MQFIKLVVKLGDHLLNSARFLLLVKLVINSILNVLICVLPLRFLSGIRLVFEDFGYFGGCVLLQQDEVLLVDGVQVLRVNIQVGF